MPSQFPDYTRHNLTRIGLDCTVTSYGDPELIGDLWNCDTVIVGGGPLMDIPQMAWLATVVERARMLGRRTIVEGCGVGPVNRPETAQAIVRIASATDEIRLRDAGSLRRLRELGVRADATVVGDPGGRWVRASGVRHLGRADGPIRVFARELTSEYPQPIAPGDATATLARCLQRVCDWFPARSVRLHAMHHFPVGGDDRMYGRRLARLIDRSACTVDEIPRTPHETLELMASASFVICMRFHSLVFAHGIGAPLLAIDYTDGGKMAHYLLEHGLERRRFTFPALDTLHRAGLIELGMTEEAALP